MSYWLLEGDCAQVLRAQAPDGSVDAIITDPPYGLRFMSKEWDRGVPPVAVWQEALRVLRPGGRLLAFAGTRTMHRMWCGIEDAGFTIEDSIAWMYGSGFPKHRSKLKPAYEPICVARKGPVSELNIDECRIGTERRTYGGAGSSDKVHNESRAGMLDGRGKNLKITVSGRWPANVMLDEEAASALDASRFFYVAKASRSERNAGLEGMPKRNGGSNAKGFTADVAAGKDRNRPTENHHPTVKPIALMRELVKLITPEGGVVLDPFCGSGTTGIACMMEGREFIGIDLSAEYLAIADRRIAHAAGQAAIEL